MTSNRMCGRALRALRVKWGGNPKGAMRALGLDASLLDEPELRTSERSGKFDPRDGGGGSVVRHEDTAEEVVRKYGSFDDLPRKIETMPQQNLGGDDEDDEWGPFRSYLEDCGLSKDEAERACEIVQDSRRRSRANGRDRSSRDQFPLNAVRSSEREPPSRGHFAGPRRHGETASGTAMDAARKTRLAKRFPGLARIECEPEARRLGGDRRRHAMDAKAATTGVRTLKRFPEMARIQPEGGTSFVPRDPATYYR
jgi:hypothetical protein